METEVAEVLLALSKQVTCLWIAVGILAVAVVILWTRKSKIRYLSVE